MPTVGVFAAIFDEQGRILCVKQNYAPRKWTTPGGRMEKGESPVETLIREVREETGYCVQPGRLIGVYSAAHKNDLVLSFEATITNEERTSTDDEIAEMGFFAQHELPHPLTQGATARIQDAFAGASAIVRTVEPSAKSGRSSRRKAS